MKVKLRHRDPDHNQRKAFDSYRSKVNCMTSPEASWVLHDAAPDEATRALLEFARTVHDLEESHPEDVDPRLKTAWDKFTSTPEGAALIRQAEGRDTEGDDE